MSEQDHQRPFRAGHGLVKVVFPLPERPGDVETMWAALDGLERYRLLNVPLFAFGVSYLDVVAADQEDGRPVFRRVVSHSGHSTYRIMVAEGVSPPRLETEWSRLGAIGCAYERATAKLLAVDVPPETDIYVAYRLLDEGMASGIWLFDEGHCGHPVSEQASPDPSDRG